MLTFYSPYLLTLIPVVVPLLVWHYIRQGHRATGRLRYSDVSRLKAVPRGKMARLRHGLFALRLAVIVLVLVALARPQAATEVQRIYSEGVDIVLALDVSNSMQAIDLDVKHKKNRLEVSKEVVHHFISKRKTDRIGLVIFGSSAFTQCPMTVDYPVIYQLLEQIEIGVVDGQSTAIGNALANAINRLRNSQAKSRVIILLTDGENNAGEIDPLTAAEMAKTFGIRVYTIGAGSEDLALVPTSNSLFGQRYQRVRMPIDEKTLKEIARITGARYFRGKDRKELGQIFEEIDALEKTGVETTAGRRYQELFAYATLPALVLLLLGILLAQTRFRMLP